MYNMMDNFCIGYQRKYEELFSAYNCLCIKKLDKICRYIKSECDFIFGCSQFFIIFEKKHLFNCLYSFYLLAFFMKSKYSLL